MIKDALGFNGDFFFNLLNLHKGDSKEQKP